MSTTDRVAERSPAYQDLLRRCTVRRILRGQSQRQLAAAAGIDNSRISAFERGTRVPTVETFIEFAAAYGFTLTREEAK